MTSIDHPTAGPLWVRRVTMCGPAEALDDRKITIAASLFNHFSKQDDHLGGHLLVQRKDGRFCATSFWGTETSMEHTLVNVESAAAQMCTTIWGSRGSWTVEVFEVVGLKPATRSVPIPEL